MSKWKIIEPADGENYVRNPQAGGTASFAGYNGAAVTRQTIYAAYGSYCYRIVPGGVDRGIRLTCMAQPANVWVAFIARDVTGALSVSGGVAWVTAVPMQLLGDGWTLYVTLSQVATGGGVTLDIRNSVNETWYIDGIMAYEGDQLQTYMDGEQAGCRWVAVPHDSASTRIVTSRAGGNILDLEDDLYFRVMFPAGGMSIVSNIRSPRPMRAGGSVDSTSILSSQFVLPGAIQASSTPQLHERLMALTDLVMPDRVPLGNDGRPQPVRIQYWGDNRVLQIAGSYNGGLDGVQLGYNMRAAISLLAANEPYWGEIITRSELLSTESSGTIRLVIRRTPDGFWDDMGPPSAVTITPDGYAVEAIAQDSEYIYVGGVFLNLDGQAVLDHMARYNPLADTWSALAATPPDGRIYAMLIDQAGNLWIGGAFNHVDGVACDYIAVRSPAGVWSEPGGGMDDVVHALTVDDGGNIYAGGEFLNAGGNPASRVAVWDGAAWAALPTAWSIDGTVHTLCWTTNRGRLYAGGEFSDYIRYYEDGGNWWVLPAGSPNSFVYSIVAIRPYVIAAGGSFTSIGGYDADCVFLYYEDYRMIPIVNGPNFYVKSLSYNPEENYLYVGGGFSAVGDMPLASKIVRLAIQYPFVYEPMPVSFDSSPGPDCRCIYNSTAIKLPTQPKETICNLIVGLNGVDTARWPDAATVTLEAVTGGAESRPVITLSRTGAGNAVISHIENLTSGKCIYLKDQFIDGETLTIDLVNLVIISSYGGVLRSLFPLPGSQFATWALLPGGNEIYVRIRKDAAVTVEGTLIYQQLYHSFMAGDA